MVGIED